MLLQVSGTVDEVVERILFGQILALLLVPLVVTCVDIKMLRRVHTLVDFHTGHHEWYEKQGKYLEKKNTFYDFVDCARYLKEKGISGAMSCEGRSAGGLLVGNAVNLAPETFNACIAGVPFVDLMTTMCDPSIPLTTEEWEEWGNPNEKKYHDYMLSYSPIDNVQAGVKYPQMLLVSGLNDPRVACWAVWKATSASGVFLH